jgi:hypothetical protein
MGRSGLSFAALAVFLLLAATWAPAAERGSVARGRSGRGHRPSAIADMEISESGGITDVFLRLMPGQRRPSPI